MLEIERIVNLYLEEKITCQHKLISDRIKLLGLLDKENVACLSSTIQYRLIKFFLVDTPLYSPFKFKPPELDLNEEICSDFFNITCDLQEYNENYYGHVFFTLGKDILRRSNDSDEMQKKINDIHEKLIQFLPDPDDMEIESDNINDNVSEIYSSLEKVKDDLILELDSIRANQNPIDTFLYDNLFFQLILENKKKAEPLLEALQNLYNFPNFIKGHAFLSENFILEIDAINKKTQPLMTQYYHLMDQKITKDFTNELSEIINQATKVIINERLLYNLHGSEEQARKFLELLSMDARLSNLTWSCISRSSPMVHPDLLKLVLDNCINRQQLYFREFINLYRGKNSWSQPIFEDYLKLYIEMGVFKNIYISCAEDHDLEVIKDFLLYYTQGKININFLNEPDDKQLQAEQMIAYVKNTAKLDPDINNLIILYALIVRSYSYGWLIILLNKEPQLEKIVFNLLQKTENYMSRESRIFKAQHLRDPHLYTYQPDLYYFSYLREGEIQALLKFPTFFEQIVPRDSKGKPLCSSQIFSFIRQEITLITAAEYANLHDQRKIKLLFLMSNYLLSIGESTDSSKELWSILNSEVMRELLTKGHNHGLL
ncbi:MAG: hypothetical protein K2X39_04110, partial [Silvanigrellaceae bacterium]|nr:hypothetical protein [Silvanigrellaceae bacterium]